MLTFGPRAVLHDEIRYPDPESFNPSRFLAAEGQLNTDIPDPVEVFGHGRRICPGRYFAMDTLWITAASILAAFEIEKPVDDAGNPKTPSTDYGPSIFRLVQNFVCASWILNRCARSFPLPFEAVFKPRYSTTDSLIRSSIAVG